MSLLFQNAQQAKLYAAFRPTYPVAPFQRIAGAVQCQSPSHHAVDIGCGTGQATVGLAEFFGIVTGIDPSPSQLQNATRHPKVAYQVGHADQTDPWPLADESLSCVTSAQAAHWFDLPVFYSHVNRVLKPGGVLAIWCYGLMYFPKHAELQTKVCEEFYEQTLGPYWDERRRIVERLYQDIPLIDEYYDNFQGIRIPEDGDDASNYDITRHLTPPQLVGYLRSWSGYTKYCQDHDIVQGAEDDPIRAIEEYLSNETSRTTTRQGLETVEIPTVWPVILLLSVKQK